MKLSLLLGFGGEEKGVFPGAGSPQLRPISTIVTPVRKSVWSQETNKGEMFGCGGSKIVFFPF